MFIRTSLFLVITVCATNLLNCRLHAQTPTEASKQMSAEERLAASAQLYKNVKTYRDEGILMQELNLQGRKLVSEKPFKTAFERGGRFRWQFRHSSVPGAKPDQLFVIWSADGKSFDSKWTVTKKQQTGQSLDMPLASAAGISSGAATAIIPLLDVSSGKSALVILSTDLVKPEDKGQEDIDKVACTKIAGEAKAGGAKVVLWIDDTGLIRKMTNEMTVDPAKLPAGANPIPKTPAFTSFTTIMIKPIINEVKIDDANFAKEEK